MKKVALMVAVLAVAGVAKAEVVVKLGTLAPQGSSWHEILKEMAATWAERSGGAVKVKIYAGGVQGSEGDMIRKLGIGQLQGAALSNVGLHDVVQEPKALSIPMLFASQVEADCALERVRPRLEEALAKRGLVAIQWSRLGALQLYCTQPRKTMESLAEARLFAQDGDAKAVEGWRRAGLRPVVISTAEMHAALTTGMIDCVPSIPIYVLATRLFERARYLMEADWGYFYGVMVIRADVWERIPADLRPILLEAAREAGRKADLETRRVGDAAIEAMARQGLERVAVDPRPMRAAFEKTLPFVRGEVVPAAIFDALLEARRACAAPAAAGR
jgi:TRAP-type C4-dicarboxylate transport system substrate-binding protein